jgi:hypothetical protein
MPGADRAEVHRGDRGDDGLCRRRGSSAGAKTFNGKTHQVFGIQNISKVDGGKLTVVHKTIHRGWHVPGRGRLYDATSLNLTGNENGSRGGRPCSRQGTGVAHRPFILLALMEGSVTAAVLALTAVGLSAGLRRHAGVNVAHGEFFMLGAVLAWFVTQWIPGSPALGFFRR